MKTTDSKLSELQMAEELRSSVARLVAPGEPGHAAADEPAQMRQRLADTAASLARYVEQHEDTLRRHRDPDGGYMETGLITSFDDFLREFGRAIDDAGTIRMTRGESKSMAADEKVKTEHQNLTLTADE